PSTSVLVPGDRHTIHGRRPSGVGQPPVLLGKVQWYSSHPASPPSISAANVRDSIDPPRTESPVSVVLATSQVSNGIARRRVSVEASGRARFLLPPIFSVS